jgi:seryl-tRNA synthetase
MTAPADAIAAAHRAYRDELAAAGLLIPLGVPGVYARGGVFEDVIDRFDRLVSRSTAHLGAEVLHFPPVLSRRAYLCTDHLETLPDVMGSVHSFVGDDRGHHALLQKRSAGEDWARDLTPTDVVLTPAACYSLYPTATGTLPAGGRLVDLRSFVFRHEPSADPARMQAFRMHEYVRLGTPAEAMQHRDAWIGRAKELLESVGLEPVPVVASDPFFGRGGRMMAATQKEQALKYELAVPVATPLKPTAVASCNAHLDHFGLAFDIRTADGAVAHSACMGFGLERVALALFKKHGFDPRAWPADVRRVLE